MEVNGWGNKVIKFIALATATRSLMKDYIKLRALAEESICKDLMEATAHLKLKCEVPDGLGEQALNVGQETKAAIGAILKQSWQEILVTHGPGSWARQSRNPCFSEKSKNIKKNTQEIPKNEKSKKHSQIAEVPKFPK